MALEQMVVSHGDEDIVFLRECYGPISFKCSEVGCLRYIRGFEKRQERNEHVRLHNRPFKCPEQGCFNGQLGFANSQNLRQHISLCHAVLAPNRFTFPSRPRPPSVDERKKFREAIKYQKLDLLRDLIHTNSSFKDFIAPDGYTGLQYAAMYGKVESARLLLHCGSNIGTATKYGTALNVACYWGKADMVQFLLAESRREEDVNSVDIRGCTPLLSILRGTRRVRLGVQWRLVQLLLGDTRVLVDNKDYKGRTLLSMASEIDSPEAVPLVEMLLKHPGIDVNARDNHSCTPLSRAASSGCVGVVKAFLQPGRGVDVDAKNANGCTPLALAAARPRYMSDAVPILKILLKHDGVHVNERSNTGRTPLSLAACSGVPGKVKALLEQGAGADVNAKDKGGRTPLSWAAARESRDKEADFAAMDNSEAVIVVKMLLEHGGVDVDSKDNDGRTPLSWAAGMGISGVVMAFIEHGIGVDLNAKDNRGRTPLSWAMARENDADMAAVVTALVEHGAVDAAL